MSVLLWKESLHFHDTGESSETLDPVWILEGQFGDEDAAKDRARLLAKAAPEGHTTGRYAISEVSDPPGDVFKASVPDDPAVTLRKVKAT
jgi:hypothetical protein